NEINDSDKLRLTKTDQINAESNNKNKDNMQVNQKLNNPYANPLFKKQRKDNYKSNIEEIVEEPENIKIEETNKLMIMIKKDGLILNGTETDKEKKNVNNIEWTVMNKISKVEMMDIDDSINSNKILNYCKFCNGELNINNKLLCRSCQGLSCYQCNNL